MLAHKKGSPVSIDVAIKLWILQMYVCIVIFTIRACHAVGYSETSKSKNWLVNMQLISFIH